MLIWGRLADRQAQGAAAMQRSTAGTDTSIGGRRARVNESLDQAKHIAAWGWRDFQPAGRPATNLPLLPSSRQGMVHHLVPRGATSLLSFLIRLPFPSCPFPLSLRSLCSCLTPPSGVRVNMPNGNAGCTFQMNAAMNPRRAHTLVAPSCTHTKCAPAHVDRYRSGKGVDKRAG